MRCPHCQAENPLSAHYCSNCGAHLKLRCASCQSELAAGARFCMHCGHPVRVSTPDDDARHARLAASAPAPLAEKALQAAITGERRVVTVLFIDVVGSTQLAEQVDLESWTAIMNGVFDHLTPAIYRYEGTIARLLGDSLVAFFGAPLAHEDDPARAVRAALDALQVSSEYAAQVRQVYGIELALRFCLNTGPVVVGQVGNDLKYEFTAVGGAVNLAARLKFAAQPMTVLVSEHTHRFIAPLFETSDLGLIEVKDRHEPIHIYQVQRLKAEPGSLRGLAGLESPLVGRDRELRALLQMFQTVRAGVGRAGLVIGEPGLGKSRLIAEWQAAIATSALDPAPQWAVGNCLSYGQSMPYHLVQDLLRSLLGLPDTASEPQVRAGLSALVQDLFGDPHIAPAQEVYPFLGHLLALELDEDEWERIRPLDALALQAQYIAALRKLILALAGQRPVILVLEDLHWSDPSSVDLFSQLLSLVSSAPLLFCFVTRPEEDAPGWKLVSQARQALGRSLTEVTLDPLSELDSRQLVANLLEIEALPEAIRALILQKSEGNPFFVEEVVRMLIERGAITRQGTGWVAGKEIESIEIPDNLQGLLLARIDRLSDQGKYTLRVASVVGRQFPFKVLEQVLAQAGNSEAGGALGALSNLESAGLIRMAQVQPDLEYLFRHTLVQEAAYSSLLASDRRRLHGFVGQAIERMYPDRLESRELAPRLGQHFSAAGDQRRALKYFTVAGQSALASYANQEAEVLFRRGLELAESDAQCARLLAGLAEALARQSRYDEALQTWRESIARFKALDDLERMARLYAQAARAAWWAGRTPEGLKLCQEGLEAVSGAQESVPLAMLVHETARAYYFNGVPDQALTLCRRSLEMAERLGSIEVQADALATLGILPDQSPEAILDALTRAVELAESAELLEIAKRAHINLGSAVRNYQGDLQAARQHYQRAVDIARLRGVAQEELVSLMSLVGLSFDMGELSTIQEFIPRMEYLITLIPDPDWSKGEVEFIQAALYGTSGNWNPALAIAHEGMSMARRRGDLQNLQNLASFLANATTELHLFGQPVDWQTAEAALNEAVEITRRGVGDPVGALGQLSMLHVRQNHLEQAQAALDEARREAERHPSVFFDGYFAWVEASLAARQGRWSAALSAYESAVGVFARLGQRWVWARVLLDWAEALAGRGEPGDPERAWGLYLQSSARFEEMGASGYVDLIAARLEGLREKTLAQAAAHHAVSLEMAQAGRIQASFLPEQLPELPGWSLAARLEPARETSGDFYDFIPLPEGRLGIVVADVADKGAGAALFMASSRTLLRTFAEIYPAEPEKAIASVNQRMLADTHAGLFVTVFYAVLDPATGWLAYCNAGHNPPLLFNPGKGEDFRSLAGTGFPVGITESGDWQSASLQLSAGDVLVVYTDGLTEAQNPAGEFFGEARLRESIAAALAAGAPLVNVAGKVLENLLGELHAFTGGAPRADDITLVVLAREPSS